MHGSYDIHFPWQSATMMSPWCVTYTAWKNKQQTTTTKHAEYVSDRPVCEGEACTVHTTFIFHDSHAATMIATHVASSPWCVMYPAWKKRREEYVSDSSVCEGVACTGHTTFISLWQSATMVATTLTLLFYVHCLQQAQSMTVMVPYVKGWHARFMPYSCNDCHQS